MFCHWMWKLHVPRQIFHVWNSKENHWNYIWKFLMKLFSCAFHTAKPVSYLSQWDSERWSYPECRKKRIKSMEKSTNVKCLVGTNRIPGYCIIVYRYTITYMHYYTILYLYLVYTCVCCRTLSCSPHKTEKERQIIHHILRHYVDGVLGNIIPTNSKIHLHVRRQIQGSGLVKRFFWILPNYKGDGEQCMQNCQQ